MPAEKLRIATCQFAECWNPRRNASVMIRYMNAARGKGADVVHFHEGALSGYRGTISSRDYDWPGLKDATLSVCRKARELGLWTIVGSAHPLTPPHRPHNSLYVVGPDGKIRDRYDKRFLMADEMKVYTPGDHFVTFRIKGVTCGLLICFDLRFPELYRELVRLGARVLFQSFNNGRMDGPGIHQHIMPQTLQAHAACNTMYISAANSSAWYSRWGGVFVRPDGYIHGRLTRNRAGMMINEVDLSRKFYDPVSEFRPLAMAGILHSGRCVSDPRSRDRKGL